MRIHSYEWKFVTLIFENQLNYMLIRRYRKIKQSKANIISLAFGHLFVNQLSVETYSPPILTQRPPILFRVILLWFYAHSLAFFILFYAHLIEILCHFMPFSQCGGKELIEIICMKVKTTVFRRKIS